MGVGVRVQVEAIIFNPQEAMRLKQQQLRNLAEMNGSLRGGPGQGEGDGHYGPPGSRPKPGLGYGGGGGGGGDSHYGPTGGAGQEETEEVQVPQNMVGLIIGKGGENIQRMQQQSGCSVQVAKDPGMPGDTTRTVTLRGARSAIDEARRMIQEVRVRVFVCHHTIMLTRGLVGVRWPGPLGSSRRMPCVCMRAMTPDRPWPSGGCRGAVQVKLPPRVALVRLSSCRVVAVVGC
jgi:hypothetical protein